MTGNCFKSELYNEHVKCVCDSVKGFLHLVAVSMFLPYRGNAQLAFIALSICQGNLRLYRRIEKMHMTSGRMI